MEIGMEEGKLGGVRRRESRVDVREGNVGAAQLVFVLLLLYCGLHIGSQIGRAHV